MNENQSTAVDFSDRSGKTRGIYDKARSSIGTLVTKVPRSRAKYGAGFTLRLLLLIRKKDIIESGVKQEFTWRETVLEGQTSFHFFVEFVCSISLFFIFYT